MSKTIGKRIERLEASNQEHMQPDVYVLVDDEPEPPGVRPHDIVLRMTQEQKERLEREVERTTHMEAKEK